MGISESATVREKLRFFNNSRTLTSGCTKLTLVNGFFGERLTDIAQAHGVEVVPVTAPWGQPIDVDAVRATLDKEPGIACLIGVHHETSTGVLNPVADLGAVCREFDVPFIVDATSSLDGEDLAMDDWGIDICVATCNKCLEALPGLAPVAVSPCAWDLIDRHRGGPSGWYLNLRVWRRSRDEWWGWHPAPVTIPTGNVLALYAALDQLYAEGLQNRLVRYRTLARLLRTELRNLGFELFADEKCASSSVTAVRRLPGMDVARLVDFLRNEFGILIASGLGETRGEIFRVGHKVVLHLHLLGTVLVSQPYCTRCCGLRATFILLSRCKVMGE